MHHSDGKQHSDLEADLLPSTMWQEEGEKIQTQEEEDRQHKASKVENRFSLHFYLLKDVGHGLKYLFFDLRISNIGIFL